MEKLLEIEDIDPKLVELIEAAGFLTPEQVAARSAEHIHAELLKANSVLSLIDEVPALDLVKTLREHCAASIPQQEVDIPQTHTITSVKEVQTAAPVLAIPLSDEFIEEYKIDLSSLPTVCAVSDVQVKPSLVDTETEAEIEPVVSVKKSVDRPEPKKRDFDTHRVKTFEDLRNGSGTVAPLERSSANDLTKAPKEGTNAGVSPDSRKYIRGVLHKEPKRTFIGSIAFIVSQVLLVLSILPVIYIVLNTDEYAWGALTPIFLILSGVIYASMARQTTCPVCRQRQFVAKSCRKHVKAHTLPVLGHMLPTAIHVLLYKWFHCIFCGTSIRVKE